MSSPRRVAWATLVDFERDDRIRVGERLDQAARELAPRDAAFAREVTYGVMRRRRLLDHALLRYLDRGLPEDPRLAVALRVGCYELVFMRTPKHAAVHEAVGLVVKRRRGVVNAVLRRVAESLGDDGLVVDLPQAPVARAALEYSLPDFLAARWFERFGADVALAICKATVAPPPMHLRATARAGDGLAEALREAGVEFEPTDDPTLLRVTGGSSPFGTQAFADGHFVVQDPTSVAAGRALGAQPGETVVDFCAAPGTKTTQLAEAVGPDGRVFAWDPAEERRERIAENVARLGLDNVTIVTVLDELPRDADRVLVDAPCSNSGVLGRRVEVRERITIAAIESLARQQREILAAAAGHLKPGGTLVYATCSIESDENEDVAAASGLTLREQHTTLPSEGVRDGGYYAVLERAD